MNNMQIQQKYIIPQQKYIYLTSGTQEEHTEKRYEKDMKKER